MPAKNDHTGDEIKTGVNSDAYRNSALWDNIAKEEKEKEANREKDENVPRAREFRAGVEK